MKVATKEFKKVLERTSVQSRKSNLPILNSYKIESDGKRLTVTATDLEAWAVASCGCEGELAPACVNAGTLKAFVASAGETVALSITGNKLSIKGNGTAGIVFMPGDEFPPLPIEGKLQGVSVTDLADGIDQVKWAVDTAPNFGRPNVNVVHVASEGKKLVVEASNGRRCAQFVRLIISASADFIFVPDQATRFCESLREQGAALMLSDKYMIAKSPDFSVMVRLSEGNYFNMSGVVNAERMPIGEFDLPELIEALDCVAMVKAYNSEGHTHITPCKDGLRVDFIEAEGEYSTLITGKFTGEPFHIHAGSTAEMLRKFPGVKAKAFLSCNTLVLAGGDYVSLVSLLKRS